MAYRNIVVAVNGSTASGRALQRAVCVAQAVGARLTVLGVDEPILPFTEGADQGQRNEQLHTAVEIAVDAARRAGVAAQGLVIAGYPAEVIVRYSTEHDSDLIVLGATDQGMVSLGATADKVVDLARCGVLIAR
jgi:nucleotide-binding universal stress UspA family protein